MVLGNPDVSVPQCPYLCSGDSLERLLSVGCHSRALRTRAGFFAFSSTLPPEQPRGLKKKPPLRQELS